MAYYILLCCNLIKWGQPLFNSRLVSKVATSSNQLKTIIIGTSSKHTKLFQIRSYGDVDIGHNWEKKWSTFLGEKISTRKNNNIESPSDWIESCDATQESTSKLKALKVDVSDCGQVINIIGDKATFRIEASDDSCGVNDSQSPMRGLNLL